MTGKDRKRIMATEYHEIGLVRIKRGKQIMKKQKRGILLSLFLLAGIFWITPGKQAAAAESAPVLEYLYTGEDGTGGQVIVASVRTGGESLERAELSWQEGEEIRSISAVEVLDGYAAFLMEGMVIREEQMRSLTVGCGGGEHVFDIQEFRNAEDTLSAAVEEETEEIPVAEDAAEIGAALEEAETSTKISGRTKEVELTPGNGLNRVAGDIVVVLDPGHGGSDGGAYRTWNSVTYMEKEITLKISKYTKQELEKYAGVKVYLTRNSDVAVGLQERVDYAASVGATVLVSQHINSTLETQTTATGAEVMVSSGNYRPGQAKETAVIARTILAELENIGFKNRDLVYKLSETGNTYPNGKLADYYAIVRYSVQAGFPGMIVEHGFVSNPEDCVKYYGSNAKMKKLGVADATAIAKYYGLQKKVLTGWNQEKGKWFYVGADGQRAGNGWLNLDGSWYYLDENGYRATGWKEFGRQKHYFNSDGVGQTGVARIDGKLYYFNSKGVLKKGFIQGIDGNRYYADKNGVLQSGWKTWKGHTYYFIKKNGAARTGWAKLGKYYYYFDEEGRMKKGIVTVDGEEYYLNSQGRKTTGLVTYKDRKYFFSKNKGVMRKQAWVKTGRKWYYFSKRGYALQNRSKVIDGVRYKFDKEGVCTNR